MRASMPGRLKETLINSSRLKRALRGLTRVPVSALRLFDVFSIRLQSRALIPKHGSILRRDELISVSLRERLFDALQGLFQVLHAGGKGQPHVTVQAEGRAGHQGHAGFLQQVLAQRHIVGDIIQAINHTLE